MERNNQNIGLLFAALLLAGVWLAGCGKMDETYKDFIKDGRIIYAATPGDSLKVHPGRDRIQLSWPAAPDPKTARAHIYWNDRADSMIVDLKNPPNDTVDVLINNLPEGSYLFEIYVYDDLGNRSVKTEVNASSYGDDYERSLLVRPINQATSKRDSVTVNWGANASEEGVFSELVYVDLDGNEQVITVLPERELLYLTDANYTVPLRYRTVYLPSPIAIDTFYTEYFTAEITRLKGDPIELPKIDWTATASSFDTRSGASYRPSSNAIDGDPETLWVNQINPQTEFPHTITVDMGEMQEGIEGFAIISRLSAASRAKNVEFQTSEDGETWQSHGNRELANVAEKQFFDVDAPVNARYFQMIAKDAHDGGKNIALAEIGVYRY
ncbi:MAG TPA: DUF4998 domain-containing protein [Parapedobacter sp.]|uniref:DUF4998 domain-containing protein n=1 Tax=Parapedobacter sp. TaxID=1958893 RepID=UPI002BA42B64|nr:DUF4998 domain-containing protein [Parapedobacter sp.]HWK56708.1 DUF4998 domain-containing protein [Parapedobacter sp.]